MAEMQWGGVPVYRALQIILAITGLIVQLQTAVFGFLLALYIVALIYLTMILICMATSRSGPSSTVEVIVEVVLGLCLVIYSVIIITNGYTKDGWLIATIVISFVLAALLFLTAWDKR